MTIKPYSGVWTSGSHSVNLGTLKNELKLTNTIFVSSSFSIKNESSIPDLALSLVFDISSNKSGSAPTDSTSSAIRLKFSKIPQSVKSTSNVKLFMKEVGVDSLYEAVSISGLTDTTLEVYSLSFLNGKSYNFVLKVNNDVTVKASPVLNVKYIAP